jgi:hypothetical protein
MCGGHRVVEGPGLVTLADLAAHHVDPDSIGAQFGGDTIHQLAGFVRGIIEHLDLMEMARIVERGDGTDGTLRDVELVVERELRGDFRKVFDFPDGMRPVPLVFDFPLPDLRFLCPTGEQGQQDITIQSV